MTTAAATHITSQPTVAPEGGTEVLLDERGSTHGDAYAQMGCTGRFWSEYLTALGWTPPAPGAVITAAQADLMMVLLKVSRTAHGQAAFADHYDDMVGYTAMAKDHANR